MEVEAPPKSSPAPSDLRESEVSAQLQKALSASYWEGLSALPSAVVDAVSSPDFGERTPADTPSESELLDRLKREGYFQIEAIISAPVMGRMLTCVETLRREGWPPVFAYVYDEFWSVARLPPLVRLLRGALGHGYKQLPHIWLHYVEPQEGAHGWPPHIDSYERAHRLSVWFALSDATLDNGCMYLIPKDLTPRGVTASFDRIEPVGMPALLELLQGVRALPVRAGSALCWEHDVIHWGSTCRHRTPQPRISLSLEFIGERAAPAEDELPLLDCQARLPTFVERLRVIGRAIGAYAGFEPLPQVYSALAKRLAEAV